MECWQGGRKIFRFRFFEFRSMRSFRSACSYETDSLFLAPNHTRAWKGQRWCLPEEMGGTQVYLARKRLFSCTWQTKVSSLHKLSNLLFFHTFRAMRTVVAKQWQPMTSKFSSRTLPQKTDYQNRLQYGTGISFVNISSWDRLLTHAFGWVRLDLMLLLDSCKLKNQKTLGPKFSYYFGPEITWVVTSNRGVTERIITLERPDID